MPQQGRTGQGGRSPLLAERAHQTYRMLTLRAVLVRRAQLGSNPPRPLGDSRKNSGPLSVRRVRCPTSVQVARVIRRASPEKLEKERCARQGANFLPFN
jgi:hypothetical protein